MGAQTVDEVTEKYVVVYFAPDGDHRQPRPTEASARRFAERDDVRRWNPIIEKITTTVRREYIWNSADEPSGSEVDHG